VSEIVRLVKANSSKWVNERPDRPGKFAWQAGYGAFSVSRSQLPAVREYVRTQEEHHRGKTFQEEFIDFLNRHEGAKGGPKGTLLFTADVWRIEAAIDSWSLGLLTWEMRHASPRD